MFKSASLKLLPFRHADWDLCRVFYPNLFEGQDLRMDIRADEFLKPLENKPISKNGTWSYILSCLSLEFADHFASLQDLARIRGELARLGIDPMSWATAQAKATAMSAARFRGEDAAPAGVNDLRKMLLRTEHAKLIPVEARVLQRMHDWQALDPAERGTLRRAVYAKRRTDAAIDDAIPSLLFKLVEGDREFAFALFDGAGMMRNVALPQDVRDRLNEMVQEDKALLFSDPALSLAHAVEAIDADDLAWYATVYRPAFVKVLGSPQYLIGMLGLLPQGPGLVAPAYSDDEGWPTFFDFMDAHGFDRASVAAWYGAIQKQEAGFAEYLKIAFCARLRPYFEQAWKEVGFRKYYEDLLEMVAGRTGLAAGELDRWLKWEYTWEDAKSLGPILRKHTMIFGFEFEGMRKMRRRPPEPMTMHDRVKLAFLEMRQKFRPKTTKTYKKGKIVETLAHVDLSVNEVWRLLDAWTANGMSEEDRGYVEMVLDEGGFKKPKQMKRIKRRNNFAKRTDRMSPPLSPSIESNSEDMVKAERRVSKPPQVTSTGHDVVAPEMTSLEKQVDRLTEIIESPKGYLTGNEFRRFSDWMENLAGLVEAGKNPTTGVQRLEDDLRAVLKAKGLDLDRLI